MERLIGGLTATLERVAGSLFVVLFLITVLNIVLRNIAGITWLWIPPMVRMLFIWTVFLGTCVLYQRDDHLVMDFFAARLEPGRRRRLDIVIQTGTLVLLLVLVYYGYLVTVVRRGIPYEGWRIPTAYAFAAAPLSAAIMLVMCVNKLVRLIRGDRDETRV